MTSTAENLEALRASGMQAWQAITPGWERQRAYVEEVGAPVREWLVDALAPRPGQTVLELAAGAGDTGYDVAARLGPDGRLISSDLIAEMVEVARRRGRERDVANVEYRVLDAERIDLESDAVDGVLCRFGYPFTADPAAALAETRRVLRPGGRAALAVWDRPERNPFFSALGSILVESGRIAPPAPGTPGIFALAGGERLHSLLDGAGFDDIRVEEVPIRFRLGSAEEHLTIATDSAGPIALALRALGADERAAVTERLAERIAPHRLGDGYELPGVALCAVAA